MSARRRALFYFVCAQVDGLEKKWNTWSFDVEENKRLVLDEVADVGSPRAAHVGVGRLRLASRRRRRHARATADRVGASTSSRHLPSTLAGLSPALSPSAPS